MYNAQGSFARKQLEKHGWTEGSGLGTNQQGISQAIKVKIKKDSTGVGHDPGKEFTDHWWNHVYNKAASRLVVEENEDGVVLKKKEVTSKERTETAKKTLYSNFIKSSTLSNGTETKVEKEGSNSEDESHRAVPTLLLPDDELLRICGGRTGHKGARHGLKLTGKLARLEEQEKQLLTERKGNPSAPTPSLTTLNGATEDSPSCAPDDPSDSKRDGKCKKRRRDERESEDGGIEDGVALGDDSDKKVRGSPESEDSLSVCQRKKKKKRRKAREESEDEDEGRNDEASTEKETGKGRGDREETERAKKKRKKEERVDGEGEENDRAEEKRKKKERTAAECEENGKEEKKRKKKESVDNVSGKKRKEEREDRGQSENETEKKARKKGLKTENDGNTVTTEASRSPRDTEEEEERERAKVKRRKKQSKIRSTGETGDICSTSRTEAKLEETCTHTSIIAPTSSDLHNDDDEEEEEERKEKRKKSKKKKKSKSDVC